RADSRRETLDAAFHAAAHLEHFTRDDLRQRAGEFGELDRLEHLRACFARDLAILLGHERRELVDVRLEQRLVPEEDLYPLLDRRAGPARQRGLCMTHGGVDLGGG